uniref:3'(2'),5'-bisphosphate nucleotidase CysQ family protein n=1 Tax=Ornithobacterium rhinotracheale TaxID=28251 RepID=UPI001627A05E|nr:3'(2'),5'-bisphosphate nucleotidase CysQ [Ornithobacterium rhinotracheale]
MNLLEIATRAVALAGEEVLKQYQNGFSTETKADGSPVTSADLAANKILQKHVSFTDIPYFSEEGDKDSLQEIRNTPTYWIADPIDGTMDFVNKTDEYCVCLGLIENNTAKLGVLYALSLGLFYFGSDENPTRKFIGSPQELHKIALKSDFFEQLIKNSKPIPTLELPKDYTFLCSKFHMDKGTEEYMHTLEKKHQNLKIKSMGSVIKLGLIADRWATEYTRFRPVNFWDIAAGHAIAKYAGLKVYYPNTDKEITYDSEDLKVHGYSIHWK